LNGQCENNGHLKYLYIKIDADKIIAIITAVKYIIQAMTVQKLTTYSVAVQNITSTLFTPNKYKKSNILKI